MSDPLPLPSWLDASATRLAGTAQSAPNLATALPGLAQAEQLTALERLQRLRQADLTERGGAAELVHVAWKQFLRGHGPSTLVVDATDYDPKSRSAAAVLDGASWLLAEGLLIAAGLRDSRKVIVRLPQELKGGEAPFLNAADAIRALAQRTTSRVELEIQRNCRKSCWGDGRPAIESQLWHSPETWCRIALLFAGASKQDASLLTLRSGTGQRGLVELAHDGVLRRQIEAWGGGLSTTPESDALLIFDDGLGGFLPLSQAEIGCDPLAFAAAGLIPSPSTLMVSSESHSIVRQTRRALYRHWQLADDESPATRGLLIRGARLSADLTLGRGDAATLRTLDEVAAELATQGLAAAWTLGSSLRYYREQWQALVAPAVNRRLTVFKPDPAPCHNTCPAHIDIPNFIAHLGNGDYRATIEVIRQDNPLPLVCGLVCPAPCESACVRGGSNGSVFIRTLKAKAAEHCLAEGGYPVPELLPDSGKRVGIIGSGPSSLTAAYYLRLNGHQVEIFEAQEHAGGMLRYGIPAYRLPPELLDQEINEIRKLGVQIHTGARVDSLEAFRSKYDAVFLGLGTQKARLLPVEGTHLPFVLGGIDFLRAVRNGEPVRVGPRVVVIGGGNVSIDVALTALRQGATHVELTSLDKRRDLAASPGEVEIAVAEGVQLRPSWGPVRVEEDGSVVFQFCEQVKDEAGNFAPKFDAHRLLTLEADHVIFATGQGTDLSCLEGSQVENMRGFVVADTHTKMTTVPGVFAGGDGQHGPRTAVEAIQSGKIAAASINSWLQKSPLPSDLGKPVRRAQVPPLSVLAADRSHRRRAVMPERTVEETVGEGNYVQIEEGLSDEAARLEATRCLRCDICIGCGLCMAVCSEMGVDALRMGETTAGRLAYFDFERPAALCIGCGACTQVCPTGAIRLEDVDGVRKTIITGTIVREQPLMACPKCAAPTVTPAHQKYIRDRLPDHMTATLDRGICPDCARERVAQPFG